MSARSTAATTTAARDGKDGGRDDAGRDMVGSVGRSEIPDRQRDGWLDSAGQITYMRECLHPCCDQGAGARRGAGRYRPTCGVTRRNLDRDLFQFCYLDHGW